MNPADIILENISFNAETETLSGIKVTSSEAKQPQILFLHGAGQANKERALPIAKHLLAKYNIASFLFDFSGHGESTGQLSESSINKRINEAQSALRFMSTKKPLGIFGASMSGHIALALQAHNPTIQNLFLFCPALYTQKAVDLPFTQRFSDTIRQEKSWNNTAVLDRLNEFTGNLAIFIGENDVVIPQEVVQLIYDRAERAKRREFIIVPSVGHQLITAIVNDQTLLDKVTDKIQTYLGSVV